VGAPWALQHSAECLKRWRDDCEPDEVAVKCTGEWLLNELRYDPYQPNAGPVGPPFTVTTWLAKLPCELADGRRVVCTYDIRSATRQIVISLITDLENP